MQILRGHVGAGAVIGRRITFATAVTSLLLLAAVPATLAAQGITTGAIAGTVTDESGAGLSGVQIRVQNRATGFVAGSLTREDGRYRVQNLEVGGPYTVTARRIGLQPDEKKDQYVSLSQTLVLDFKLHQSVTQLAGVTIISTTAQDFSPANTGTKTAVSDTTIQRLPTLTRNLTDFIRLTPQVSQSGPGFSGGGMSNRMNNVQIDGATERDVFGLGSTGQPGAEVNSKSVSIDAVKEFQVLLAPFDVRQGNFGGLLLNAVTKSGTNDLRGTAYYFYRNQNYGADTSILRATPFDRAQFGFTIGGPIIRDKLHFFVAPEFQKENTPVTGPYYGQPSGNSQPFPLIDADRARFETIMAGLGETQLGTAGYTNIKNPLSNVFGRLDYQINDIHRLVFHYNYSRGERLRQQTGRGTTLAVYSGNFHNFVNVKNAPVLQLFSNFRNGASNELFVGYNNWYNRRTPLSRFPEIRINSITGVGGVTAGILAGADQFSQGNELDTKTYELTENYTFRPFGAHTITVGTRNEYVWLRNLFTQSSYGAWSFQTLDSLAAGNPNTFRRAIILRDGGNVYFSALQNAFYAQDQWQTTPRFSITAGLRFDLSSFLKDVPYNAAIDSAYHRRTDDVPKHSLQFSPRLGFNWDVTGDQVNQLRGGAGLFVGTPPYVWLENAYVNSGSIITFLNCTTPGVTPAPAFQKDPSSIQTCRNGAGTRPIGDVNFLAKGLKFPQPLRASLAYDRRLPWDLVATVEGLYSKTLNQLFFVSKNVAGPQGVSSTGRTLYITAVNPANGNITFIPPPDVVSHGGVGRFSTAIDLQNQNKDYSYSITGQLRKRFVTRWEGMLAYTYSRARDVQSFTSSTHISNWQFGRTLFGPQEDAYTTISLFDQPHKIVGSLTYTATYLKRWSTDFSMFYQGVSGAPHDYVYAASGGTSGDLNGDGRAGNDLIYVPRNAADPAEIQFQAFTGRTVAQQQTDFENFIKSSPCLNSHRGQILPRNSCRQPFFNQFDVAIRQNLPEVRGQRVAIQLDIFNFGNLLNKKWGQQKVSQLSSNSNIPLLSHRGYSSADPRTAVPIVRFTPPIGGEYSVGQFVSNFWRSQISFRYSF